MDQSYADCANYLDYDNDDSVLVAFENDSQQIFQAGFSLYVRMNDVKHLVKMQHTVEPGDTYLARLPIESPFNTGSRYGFGSDSSTYRDGETLTWE